jgi:pSer/pThr/pTyr-binding forkhead associated (FHA) protein
LECGDASPLFIPWIAWYGRNGRIQSDDASSHSTGRIAMQLKLKVVQGALKNQTGASIGKEIEITSRRFVIGTAHDCHMRCSGQSIDPHHCVILLEPARAVIRDNGSRGGTLINGLPIDITACLFHGDRLQVGKLEFDVVLQTSKNDNLDNPPTVHSPPTQRDTVQASDTIADLAVNLLMNADEEDRERRRFDPGAREFRLPPADSVDSVTESTKASKVFKRPEQKAPAKLPGPAEIRGEDTIDAARKALEKLLGPASKKKQG